MKKFKKSNQNVVLTGVLGGVGEYFNVDPVIVRLLFILFVILTGFFPGIFFYIVTVLLIPTTLQGKKREVDSEVI